MFFKKIKERDGIKKKRLLNYILIIEEYSKKNNIFFIRQYNIKKNEILSIFFKSKKLVMKKINLVYK